MGSWNVASASKSRAGVPIAFSIIIPGFHTVNDNVFIFFASLLIEMETIMQSHIDHINAESN